MDRNVGIFLKETFWKSQKFDNLFWALLGEKNFPPQKSPKKWEKSEIENLVKKSSKK